MQSIVYVDRNHRKNKMTKKWNDIISRYFPSNRRRSINRDELLYKVTRDKHIAPDGTPVSTKDMDLLLELNAKNPSKWLRDYKKWRRTTNNIERSSTMTKKKKTKKKVSVLDKVQKQLDKLETLHEKEQDVVFAISELIDDAQMDDDNAYHLD